MKAAVWTVLLLAAIAGGVYYYRADVGAAPPQLVFAQVTRGSVVSTVDATGTLQTVDTVEVGTQVSGTISSLGVDFNDTVKRGQIVATLDQAIFLSQIEQQQAQVIRLRAEEERARVQLLDAETKLKRSRRLGDEQLIPISDIETAEVNTELAKANLKAAQAQLSQTDASLAQAKVNLSYTVIKSPVDGIVLGRNVDVGQTVSAGLQAPTLFVIARSLDTLELAASVSESDVGRVQAGQAVTFTVDAYPQGSFTGTVRQVRLQPTVVQNVVSYTTIIDVPNPGGRLKPGMTATLSIEVERADDVLRVPAAATRFRPTEEVLLAYGGATEADAASGNQSPRSANQSPRAPGAGARGGAGGFAGRGGLPAGARGGDPAAARAFRPSGQGPATVWQLVDGTLQPVRVRAGLSDGTLVAILGGPLTEGAQVVTNALAAATTAAAPTTGSPLVPNMPRRPGGGGGPR
jgi:HlyD family secretion protein